MARPRKSASAQKDTGSQKDVSAKKRTGLRQGVNTLRGKQFTMLRVTYALAVVFLIGAGIFLWVNEEARLSLKQVFWTPAQEETTAKPIAKPSTKQSEQANQDQAPDNVQTKPPQETNKETREAAEQQDPSQIAQQKAFVPTTKEIETLKEPLEAAKTTNEQVSQEFFLKYTQEVENRLSGVNTTLRTTRDVLQNLTARLQNLEQNDKNTFAGNHDWISTSLLRIEFAILQGSTYTGVLHQLSPYFALQEEDFRQSLVPVATISSLHHDLLASLESVRHYEARHSDSVSLVERFLHLIRWRAPTTTILDIPLSTYQAALSEARLESIATTLRAKNLQPDHPFSAWLQQYDQRRERLNWLQQQWRKLQP